MSLWIAVFAAAGAGVVLFFVWANRATAKAHARFQLSDVEGALAEFVSPEAHHADTWNLFLTWPIDDPRLESIRQQCLKIVVECPGTRSRDDVSEEGVKRVAAILRELHNPPRSKAHIRRAV